MSASIFFGAKNSIIAKCRKSKKNNSLSTYSLTFCFLAVFLLGLLHTTTGQTTSAYYYQRVSDSTYALATEIYTDYMQFVVNSYTVVPGGIENTCTLHTVEFQLTCLTNEIPQLPGTCDPETKPTNDLQVYPTHAPKLNLCTSASFELDFKNMLPECENSFYTNAICIDSGNREVVTSAINASLFEEVCNKRCTEVNPKFVYVAENNIVPDEAYTFSFGSDCDVKSGTPPPNTKCRDIGNARDFPDGTFCASTSPKQFGGCSRSSFTRASNSVKPPSIAPCEETEGCAFELSYYFPLTQGNLEIDGSLTTISISPLTRTFCTEFINTECNTYTLGNQTKDADKTCQEFSSLSCEITSFKWSCYSKYQGDFVDDINCSHETKPIDTECLSGCADTTIRADADWLGQLCPAKKCQLMDATNILYEMELNPSGRFVGISKNNIDDDFFVSENIDEICKAHISKACLDFRCVLDGDTILTPCADMKCPAFTASSCNEIVHNDVRCINTFDSSLAENLSDCGAYPFRTSAQCHCSKYYLESLNFFPTSEISPCDVRSTLINSAEMVVTYKERIISRSSTSMGFHCETALGLGIENCDALSGAIRASNLKFNTLYAPMVGVVHPEHILPDINPKEAACTYYFRPSVSGKAECCLGQNCVEDPPLPDHSLCGIRTEESTLLPLSIEDCEPYLPKVKIEQGCYYLFPRVCADTCRTSDSIVDITKAQCVYDTDTQPHIPAVATLCDISSSSILDYCVSSNALITLCDEDSVTYEWLSHEYTCSRCDDGVQVPVDRECWVKTTTHETEDRKKAVFGDLSCADLKEEDEMIPCSHSETCRGKQTCVDGIDDLLPFCACENGKVGEECNTCPLSCKNGGQYPKVDQPGFVCERCICPKYYTGRTCECRRGSMLFLFNTPDESVTTQLDKWILAVSQALVDIFQSNIQLPSEVTLTTTHLSGIHVKTKDELNTLKLNQSTKNYVTIIVHINACPVVLQSTLFSKIFSQQQTLRSSMVSNLTHLDLSIFDTYSKLVKFLTEDTEETKNIDAYSNNFLSNVSTFSTFSFSYAAFEYYEQSAGIAFDGPPCSTSIFPGLECPKCFGNCGNLPEDPDTSDDGSDTPKPDDTGLGGGAIAGIVIGLLFAICLITGGGYWYFYVRGTTNNSSNSGKSDVSFPAPTDISMDITKSKPVLYDGKSTKKSLGERKPAKSDTISKPAATQAASSKASSVMMRTNISSGVAQLGNHGNTKSSDRVALEQLSLKKLSESKSVSPPAKSLPSIPPVSLIPHDIYEIQDELPPVESLPPPPIPTSPEVLEPTAKTFSLANHAATRSSKNVSFSATTLDNDNATSSASLNNYNLMRNPVSSFDPNATNQNVAVNRSMRVRARTNNTPFGQSERIGSPTSASHSSRNFNKN